MALSNAERQRRYRARRSAERRPVHYRRPHDRRSRLQRWNDAVRTLRTLQAEYQDWLDTLPEALQESAVAAKLEAICELDLTDLEEVALPLGYGRD